MGQASSGLTQYDMEELITTSGGVFSQAEVEGLYTRFRALDRGKKGYLTGDEFIAIPELSINPIAQRLVRMFESVNFKEFVRLLAPFSAKATRDMKLEAMFAVFDVDGDGLVNREDLTIMLRQLAGSSLSEDEVNDIVARVLKHAAPEGKLGLGLDLIDFKAALAGVGLDNMVVDVPREW